MTFEQWKEKYARIIDAARTLLDMKENWQAPEAILQNQWQKQVTPQDAAKEQVWTLLTTEMENR